MGDVREGDTLFDESGKPCRVTFATPVQYKRDCYRLTFADGSEITADADHQWTVYSRSKHGRRLTLTTADMLDDYLIGRREDRNERNYSVDVAGAIECPAADLPIPPYTLGVWLGDGKSDGAAIYLHDDDIEIIGHVRDDGFPARKTKRKYEWSISDGVRNRTKDCLKSRLKAIGLICNKHIPQVYLRASIEQRFALLQGLMDTDGTASKAGQCEFVGVNYGLCRGVLELVRSLGMKATWKEDRARLNGRDCGARYRVQFWSYSDSPVFRLARKAHRLKPRPSHSRNFRNYIVSIKPVDSVPVRCI